MNPITSALVIGGFIITGKWSQDDSPTMKNAVGVAGIALILAFFEQINEQFSKAFGALIVFVVAAMYLPHIVEAVGLKGSTPTTKQTSGQPAHLRAV
jgi:hypothetical protein